MTRTTFRVGSLVSAPFAAGLLLAALVAAVAELLAARTLLDASFFLVPTLIVGVLIFGFAFALFRSVWFERIEDGCVIVSFWHGGSTLAIPIGDICSWFGPVGSNPMFPESLRLLWYWVRVAEGLDTLFYRVTRFDWQNASQLGDAAVRLRRTLSARTVGRRPKR